MKKEMKIEMMKAFFKADESFDLHFQSNGFAEMAKDTSLKLLCSLPIVKMSYIFTGPTFSPIHGLRTMHEYVISMYIIGL